MANPTTIHARGKLLITGEYFVLDGATSLAVPTKLGQSFEFSPRDDATISWKGVDHMNRIWLSELLQLPIPSEPLQVNTKKGRLIQILRQVNILNPEVFSHGWDVISTLEFPSNWGLGSSSTLIYAVAKWAEIDPYTLLEKTFGGSGYDIACAGSEQAILYTLLNRGNAVDWSPTFSDQIYFVHLNQKQNSRDGIRHYKNTTIDKASVISELNQLTSAILKCDVLEEFERLITRHEQLIGRSLNLPLVQDRLFPDFPGTVKSLGAWGGDFVLVASELAVSEVVNYFSDKGFRTILSWKDMCGY